MDERNSGEPQGRQAVRIALSVGCTVLFLGVLWVVAWKMGWWVPGLGRLSVKTAAILSMGPVALVGWFARRR
ncbi:hypothetical protein [Streptomyces platensis]|uniref:hypothetical protein n=1 Tax=Streptomyces platensis TaxID=58346 RepID=UPI0037887C69